ncbi:hypothetical protein [Streptomyces yerevanensis]|uniref:hypothetical protein n=1 Tax=Streptomyces yerevanensis TaxID=66378 RepID=UPI000527D466|nr:hypothetical protein [Streptomyces yerevanensis]
MSDIANEFVEALEPASVLSVRRDARLLLDNLTSAQIEALGKAFHYGEEVVGDVKHLVDT